MKRNLISTVILLVSGLAFIAAIPFMIVGFAAAFVYAATRGGFEFMGSLAEWASKRI